MQAEQDQIQYVVIGIGLNVNQTKDDLPEEIQSKATSLQMETNETWRIKDLIQEIVLTFEKSYDSYMENGFSEVKHKWESFGFKIGEVISIKTQREQKEAIFLGIAEDGALLIKTKDGETRKLYSAEIEWFKDGEKGHVE